MTDEPWTDAIVAVEHFMSQFPPTHPDYERVLTHWGMVSWVEIRHGAHWLPILRIEHDTGIVSVIESQISDVSGLSLYVRPRGIFNVLRDVTVPTELRGFLNWFQVWAFMQLRQYQVGTWPNFTRVSQMLSKIYLPTYPKYEIS